MVCLGLVLVASVTGCAPDEQTESPTTPPTTQAADQDQLDTISIGLETLVRAEQPVDLAFHPNSSTVLLAQRTGAIVDFSTETIGDTVLDLSANLAMTGEGGLLSITYNPDGTHLFVSYVDTANRTRIDAYPVDATGTPLAGSVISVFDLAQPYTNHNGGFIRFGPDRYLYVGLGDGGSANDPDGYAQNLDSMLGSILRINPTVDGPSPYTVPADNPILSAAGQPSEIWVYGLRNPWRFSFDRDSGELFIGDVGQDNVEEINRVTTADRGANLGWDHYEGPVQLGAELADHHPPIYSYPHDGRCSVIGGYVYRGADVPELHGAYLYGDYCDGIIRALRFDGDTVTATRDFDLRVEQLSAFAETPDGEIYVLGLDGTIGRIVAG